MDPGMTFIYPRLSLARRLHARAANCRSCGLCRGGQGGGCIGSSDDHHGGQDRINSRVVGLIEWNLDKLKHELEIIDTFPANPGYGVYQYGPLWGQVWLANRTGDGAAKVSEEHRDPAITTMYGAQLPYIMSVLDSVFYSSRIKSIRVIRTGGTGGIVPHRDYMEFKDGFTRLHLPIRTDQSLCFNSEGDSAYHMPCGQIVYLDGREPHAALSRMPEDNPRIHLMVDFDPNVPIHELFRESSAYTEDTRLTFIERPPMPAERVEALRELGRAMNHGNYRFMLEMLSIEHFYYRIPVASTYGLLLEAAARSGDDSLVARAEKDIELFLGPEYLTAS